MKNKGISLIVLIITIVVIIILATAIIVNLVNTNVIKNADIAVLKSDISNFKAELELYVSNKYVDTKGVYDRKKLNADQNIGMYDANPIEDSNKDGSSNIYDILSSLKKSKWENIVYIEEGKIVFKKNGLSDEEIKIVIESGIEVSGMPKITNIITESTYTTISITLTVNMSDEVEKYKYILDNGKIEESTELTKTYTGLAPETNYMLEVIMILKDGTEISKTETVSTKSIDGKIEYTLSETEFTKNDITVTLGYSEEVIPEGYEIQYKTKDVDGNVIQDWTSYTSEVVVTENNTILIGRLYNNELEIERAGSSTIISNIDRIKPTVQSIKLMQNDDNLKIVTSCSDNNSINEYKAYVNNTIYNNVQFSNNTITSNISTTSLDSINYYTIISDLAGNNTKSTEITVKKDSKMKLESIVYDENKNAKVKFSVEDGIDDISYFTKNGEEISNEELEKIDENTFVYIFKEDELAKFGYVDTLGNVSDSEFIVDILGLSYVLDIANINYTGELSYLERKEDMIIMNSVSGWASKHIFTDNLNLDEYSRIKITYSYTAGYDYSILQCKDASINEYVALVASGIDTVSGKSVSKTTKIIDLTKGYEYLAFGASSLNAKLYIYEVKLLKN